MCKHRFIFYIMFWLHIDMLLKISSTSTFVLLCKVVCHLPVFIAVQDTVGDVQVICCHLVDTLWNAYERGGGAATL